MTASEKRKRKNANRRVKTRVPYISVHLRKERDWCFKERSPNILFRMTLCQSTKYRSAFLRMWDTNRLPLWYTSQRRSKYVAFVGPFASLCPSLSLCSYVCRVALQCRVTRHYNATWRCRMTSHHRDGDATMTWSKLHPSIDVKAKKARPVNATQLKWWLSAILAVIWRYRGFSDKAQK